MVRALSYTLIGRWLGAEEARTAPLLAALLPHQLLLLFSEGSMTVELELLSGARVDAEVVFTGCSPLRSEDAAFVGARPGQEAIEREVWLTAAGRRLLCARTLIPSGMIDERVRASLDEQGSEPLGRVLASMGVLFAKEGLEVGIVRSEAASRELGLAEQTPLFARRYILFNGGGDSWTIKAAVTEIFSPALIPATAGAEH